MNVPSAPSGGWDEYFLTHSIMPVLRNISTETISVRATAGSEKFPVKAGETFECDDRRAKDYLKAHKDIIGPENAEPAEVETSDEFDVTKLANKGLVIDAIKAKFAEKEIEPSEAQLEEIDGLNRAELDAYYLNDDNFSVAQEDAE